MKKVPLLFGIVCFTIYRTVLYATDNLWLSLLIFLIPILLLIFNFTVRKRLSFANWFLSPWNFLLERTIHISESELDTDLLYDKLLELNTQLPYKLLDSDSIKKQLLFGTSVNFLTWGENIYIQLIPANEGSTLQFTSVTLFGNTSWKRNDTHFHAFIELFESSLTI